MVYQDEMPTTPIPFTPLHMFRRLLCVGLFLFAGIHTTLGATLPLPSTSYKYTVLDQDLSAALQEFGNNLKISVNISAEVKGRIRGRIPELSPREFLDRLTDLYDLQWYYDGVVLYVSAAKEAQTRMLVLSSVHFSAFKLALDKLDISDERYPVRPAPGNGLVLVSGPPRFMALIEQTLNGLLAVAQAQPRATDTPARESVMVLFRGSSTTVVRGGRPEVFYTSEMLPENDDGGKAELSKK